MGALYVVIVSGNEELQFEAHCFGVFNDRGVAERLVDRITGCKAEILTVERINTFYPLA